MEYKNRYKLQLKVIPDNEQIQGDGQEAQNDDRISPIIIGGHEYVSLKVGEDGEKVDLFIPEDTQVEKVTLLCEGCVEVVMKKQQRHGTT